MAKRLSSTPRADGFHMPGEFEPQKEVFMIWPERPDNWRDRARPAQEAYARVAEAISAFTPVTMLASVAQYARARQMLPSQVRVVEASSDDAWCRDVGPTFVVNDAGEVRGVDWTFNAWGGLTDGLYFPWDRDDGIAQKICELERIDSYRTEGFVLEGGSIHVDGEGTVLTTRMCLGSPGRNPHLGLPQIEEKLKDYLGAEKVIWLEDGIDPEETNGHIDDVACFLRPGEVVCIDTENVSHPFYRAAKEAQRVLRTATDARGRRLRVHLLPLPEHLVTIGEDFAIQEKKGTLPRRPGDMCIATYANFLITGGGVIVPQFGDPMDERALSILQDLFPERKVVGVMTREIVYGGGNIHCITQQLPG